jgi:outer membrane protein
MQTEIEMDYSQLNIEIGNNKETTPEQNKKIKQLQKRLEEINEYREKVKDESKTKTTALLNPIIAKAKNAIDQVAKENNYNLVIDSSKDTYLYIQGIEDIMPLVLKKLYKSTPVK